MASIEPRANGTYRARVRRQGAPDISRTFDTEADANDWATATEAAVRAGRLKEHLQRSTTLGELLKAYRDKVTPTKRGHRQEYTRIAALLLDPIADYSLENLTRQVFRDYRDRRLKTITGSTVNRLLSLFSAVLKWSAAELDAPVDPRMLDNLKQAENPERERRLMPGEMERLQAAAPPWLKAYITVAVETCARRGELAGLQWRDIDLRRRVARLHQTKNGHGRDLPLSSRAVAALESLPRSITGGAVFDKSPDAITLAFIECCKAAGISGLRLHDLRAEGVSRLFERGLDLNSVKAISGHRSGAFLRYMREGNAEALAQKLG